MIVVGGAPLRLPVWGVRSADIGAFIIIQAEPVQAVDQFLFCAGFIAFLVGVLDAQDELASQAARKQERI